MAGLAPRSRNRGADEIVSQWSHASVHTADPGEADTVGSPELGSRVSVSWNAASAGLVTQSADINFTIGSGTVVEYVSFWDAASGGNYQGSLQVTQITSDGTVTLSNMEVEVGAGGAAEFVVQDQSYTPGALTRQTHAAYLFSASIGTITTVGTLTGANSTDFSASVSGGVVKIEPTANGIPQSSYALSLDVGDGTTTTSINISFPSIAADTYTVGSDAEFTTVEGLLGAVTSNVTINPLELGDYTSGWTLQPTSSTATITIQGQSATNKPDIGSIYIRDITQNGNVTLRWLKTNDPRQNIFNSGIIYDRPGNIFTVEECEGVGPFTPDLNTDRTYYAAVDYINGTGVPVIGRTLTDGSNQAEILDVDDNGDGTGTVYVSDLSSEGSENWTLGATLTESTSSNTFEVSVTKYGGLPDAQRSTAIQSGGGLSDWNQIIVRDCIYQNFTQGIFARANDNIEFHDNQVINHYEDSYKTDPEDLTAPATVLLDGNMSLNCYSNPIDFNNPHADGIQLNGNSCTDNWAGTIQNNKFIIGDTRGSGFQCIFLEGLPSPHYFQFQVRNNLCVTKDSQHGITIQRSQNCGIHNNTVVVRDPVESASDFLTLSIRTTTDGGGNSAQNNVCDSFAIPSFAVGNNVTLGKAGATISYATAFNPDTFSAPSTLNESITQYEPEPNGPLLAGAFYVIGDTGCIDNTPAFVDWDPTSVGDITAPTLTLPTDAANGETAFTGTVTTNDDEGTLYWVVTQSATSPTALQVRSGQDHTGASADATSTQSVTATGLQNVSGSGLIAGTQYYAHYMHEDVAGNRSNVASADGFTTDSAAGFNAVDNSGTASVGYGTSPAPNFGSNSSNFIISTWVRLEADETQGFIMDLRTAEGSVEIGLASSERLRVTADGVTTANNIFALTNAGPLSLNTWHHILCSASLGASPDFELYIDDTRITSWALTPSPSTDTFSWASGNRYGILQAATGGSRPDVSVSQMYFNTQEYLDLTVESNRRLFISSTGGQVDLGSDGSTPTGNQPAIYFANPATSFATNLGSAGGGNLTGTFTDVTAPGA